MKKSLFTIILTTMLFLLCVSAYGGEVKEITGLGTGVITNPVHPANTDSAWSGSYVYYGKYDGTNPTKYRVLDKEATEFGGNTLFLDCDSVLYNDYFNKDGDTKPGAQKPNEWAYSDVKTGLSGSKFLEKSGNFSDAEKDAMALSTVGAHDLVKAESDNVEEAGRVSNWSYGAYGKYVALNNEKVFLLDAEDASNNKYGYSMTDNSAANRRKNYNGSASWWWLRSAFSNNGLNAGFVYVDGGLGVYNLKDVKDLLGVSPAFNVNLGSVIFTSLISGTSGQPGAEYKLTLSDNNIRIAAENVTRSGDTVTVPYTITGDNAGKATQISVLITDSPYSSGTALTSGYEYMKLDVGTLGASGTGTFQIPDSYKDKTWGTDYYVYILAEDVNDGKETDYASAPVSIMPVVSATVTGYENYYDGRAHGISLTVSNPANATVKYGEAEGSYTLDASATITSASDSPKTVYYKLSAPGYLDTFGSAKINIKKVPLTVTAKPNTITYGDSPVGNGVDYSGFVNNETASDLGGTLGYDYSYSKYGDIGNSYTITPKGQTSDNYDITFKSGTLAVNKKEVSLNWTNTTLSYNGLEQVPTVTAEGLVNSDTCKVNITGAAIDAGTYTATAMGLSNGNYKLPDTGTTAEFTINKAVYGGAKTAYVALKPSEPATDVVITLPDLPEGAVYAASGTVSGDTELIFSHSVAGNTLTFSTTEQTDFKTAVITIVATGAKNYLDYEVKATITSKNEADISIKGGDRTVTYGDEGFTLGKEVTYPGDNGQWKFTSGNPEIAKVDEKTGEVEIVSAGETTITAVYESDTTYGEKSINIKVNKAPLTITANDNTITYGEEPTGNGVSYNGFRGTDTEKVLSGAVAYAYDYEKGDDIGEYSITPSGLSSSDYEISYVKGVLTVEKAAPVLTKAPEAKAGLVYNGEAQELVSPGEADGGEMRYALTKDDNKPDASDYSASVPTARDAGEYTVWYKVFGDKNHSDTGAQSINAGIAEKSEPESTPEPDPEPAPKPPVSGNTVKPDKVPLVPYSDAFTDFASSDDNIAARVPGAAADGTGGSIKKQELDFINVLTSGVDPSALKMTTIASSKFKTTGRVKDKSSVATTGGVKAKFNKKDSTVTITCKSSGSAAFTMEDGNTYTVNFTVEKPRAVAAAKTMAVGSAQSTKTLMDLFGTHIDSGKLSILKQKHSQATLSGNMLIVNPAEKDSIKIQYQYLNKKYKMAIKVK